MTKYRIMNQKYGIRTKNKILWFKIRKKKLKI